MPTYLKNIHTVQYSPSNQQAGAQVISPHQSLVQVNPQPIVNMGGCRNVFEHVKGCPVCLRLFANGVSDIVDQQHNNDGNVNNSGINNQGNNSFTGGLFGSTKQISMSSTTAILIAAVILLLLVFLIRK